MNELATSIAASVQQLFNVQVDVVLSRPDPQFGDVATNVALQLAKQVGENPRAIAEQLAAELRETLKDQVSEIAIAGPGFINIRFDDQYLLQQAHSPQQKGEDTDRVVIIETNNPNPFKAMHIGHAFNAIIADTIANLLEAAGNEVHRVSYHGDIGAHVGKSMYSILKYVDGDPARLEEIEPAERNRFMSRMYAEGAAAYKEDLDAKAAIDELAKQSFSRKDPLYAAVYGTCKAWSFEQIDDIVGRIGNKPIEKRFLESEADPIGVSIVKAHVPKVFQESDGALIFPGSQYGSFDNVFVTASGLGLYAARDLGLMKLKHDYLAADKSYIVTAEEQRDYFKGVIAAAEQSMPEFKDVTVNIPTGTVKLTTGKMSSRSGDVIEIAWLFDEVGKAITARGGTPTDDFVAAVLRYQFLKVRVGGDVVFDVGEAVSIEGNSGPYLQYAHARAQSIMRKSTIQASAPGELQEDERLLVAKIAEYSDVCARAVQELSPHVICTYLYELAQVFNRFYEHNRVVGDAREAERLYLVQLYADTLQRGLGLLGIHAPESM